MVVCAHAVATRRVLGMTFTQTTFTAIVYDFASRPKGAIEESGHLIRGPPMGADTRRHIETHINQPRRWKKTIDKLLFQIFTSALIQRRIFGATALHLHRGS